MKKIMIIGPSVYNLNNLSDDSMLYVFIRDLRKIDNNLDIVLLARHPNTKYDELYGVRSIKNLDHNCREESIGRWFNGLNANDDTSHLKKIYDEIKDSDLIVIGAEPFLEVTTGFYRGPASYAALMITIAKFFNKPIMIFGIHMGRPVESKLGLEILKYGIDNANLITLREKYSQEVLKKYGIQGKKIVSLSDPAFGLKKIDNIKLCENILKEENISFCSDNIIGVTFRHMYWKWGENEWARYSKIMANVLDEIINETKSEIIFIPNCTYDVDNKYEDDRNSHLEIKKLMVNKNKSYLIQGNYNILETLSLYQKLDITISNRRHPSIFGAIYGLPSVGLGEEWHILPVFSNLGIEDCFINLESLDESSLKKTILNVLDNRKEYQRRIKRNVVVQQNLSKKHAQLAFDLLKGDIIYD